MGTLSYTLPSLNTTGSQPATDIVAALNDIKTESNGLVEAGNLASKSVTALPVDTERWFSFPSRVTTSDSVRLVRIPVTESLVSVYVRTTLGTNNAAADIEINGDSYIVRSGSDGSGTYATIPGEVCVTDGLTGAPLLFESPGSNIDIWLLCTATGISPSAYVENMIITVVEHGDF